MVSFMTDEIKRLRPSTKIERGSEVPDWAIVSELIITGCTIQPESTTLSQDGRVLGVSDTLKCFLPYADVKAGDKIIFEGNEYAIEGEPMKWKSPTGNLNNLQLTLKRWRG